MILDTIIKYGLSVRQIPLNVVSRYSYNGQELAENQVLEVWKPDLSYFEKYNNSFSTSSQKMMDFFYTRFPEGRTFIVETKVPKNAGYWMCKQVKSTSREVGWDSKTDNLAATLEESINLFLAKNL